MIVAHIPNILTIFRFILVPVFLFFLVQNDLNSKIIAIVIFSVASITDFFDGYLARKLHQESKMGAFLDPLADKFLVIAAMMAFVNLDKQIPFWMVAVVILRDILITAMRYKAKKMQKILKTSNDAKVKTAFQMISIILILLIFAVRSYKDEIRTTFTEGKKAGKKNHQIATESLVKGLKVLKQKNKDHEEKKFQKQVFAESIPYFLMLIVTILTIISGIRYIISNNIIFLALFGIQKRE